MQTTIRRTEKGAYGGTSAAATGENAGRCPFRAGGRCGRTDCSLWNDDLGACGLSPDSLQLLMRTAITDAAAEIHRYMGDDRR